MSKITATHKDGWQLIVCIADEEWPDIEPIDVGRAFVSYGTNGVPVPDEDWVDIRCE